VTRIVPLMFVAPIFVLVLAFVFLEEIPSATQIAGIVVTVLGATMIGFEDYRKFAPEKGGRYSYL
jgi:drug/metabolite transporter (DMT)-like permease